MHFLCIHCLLACIGKVREKLEVTFLAQRFVRPSYNRALHLSHTLHFLISSQCLLAFKFTWSVYGESPPKMTGGWTTRTIPLIWRGEWDYWSSGCWYECYLIMIQFQAYFICQINLSPLVKSTLLQFPSFQSFFSLCLYNRTLTIKIRNKLQYN